MITNWS